jgi:hypothetical protein
VEALGVAAVVSILPLAGFAVSAAWRGYHRRRDHWTPSSWIGLGLTLLVGLSLLGLLFVSSAAVDTPAPWVGASHSGTRSGWVLVALGSMIGGVLLVVGSLQWFAVGPPTRQFPLLGSLFGARRTMSPPDRPVGQPTPGSRHLPPNDGL